LAIIIITRRQARKNNGNRERRTRLGLTRVCGKKFFGGGRVWGVGCGVWGFTSFEVANYLIFREKVSEKRSGLVVPNSRSRSFRR